MNKKFGLFLISLLLFSAGFSTNQSCSFRPGNFVWRCSNNSPAVNIAPGQTGQIIINCCYTGPGLEDTDEFSLSISKLDNYTSSVQQPDYSWVTEVIDYTATRFITSIDYPLTINPNTDVEIIIHFSLPFEHDLYEPNAVLSGRADFKLNGGTGFILNNVIVPRVVIPANWNPPFLVTARIFLQANSLPIIGFGVLKFAVIAFLFYNKRVTKKE